MSGEYDEGSTNLGAWVNIWSFSETSSSHSASGGLGVAASSKEVSTIIILSHEFSKCRNWCRACRILISELLSPSLTFVNESSQGTLSGFIDHDSESRPANIMMSAVCPKASLGVNILILSHSILGFEFCSLTIIILIISINFNLLFLSSLVRLCNSKHVAIKVFTAFIHRLNCLSSIIRYSQLMHLISDSNIANPVSGLDINGKFCPE